MMGGPSRASRCGLLLRMEEDEEDEEGEQESGRVAVVEVGGDGARAIDGVRRETSCMPGGQE